MRTLKCAILLVCEALGLFRVSRAMFGKRLTILCYHGFQLEDECRFRPQLFISPQTLEQRLAYMGRRGFRVLELGDAIRRLKAGTLPPKTLAVTIDDGFASTLAVGAPLFERHGVPATVYVTTYYVNRNVPVFRLAVQYLFWRAEQQPTPANLAALWEGLSERDFQGRPEESVWTLIRHGEALPSEDDRQRLLARLARALNVDTDRIVRKRLLTLLSPEEVRTLSERGFGVEMHTHRHRFPLDREAARREIEENRVRLQAMTGRVPRHFCYPSGVFDPVQWPWLESFGVESATTCIAGMNAADAPSYGLKRFLDSEDVRFIEFRAELEGFGELLRWIRAKVAPRRAAVAQHHR